MDGQGQVGTWVRKHVPTLVRLSILIVCAGLLAVVVRDRIERPSEADAPDPALMRANQVAKWNALALAWERHERAAARGDVDALRAVTAQPVLDSDLQMARSGRPPAARELSDATVWLPLPSRRSMIAVALTAEGSSRVVAFTRASTRERWRLAVDVGFAGWPWGPDRPSADSRPIPFPVAVPLRALRAGRPMIRTAVAVPLSNGWTAICAGLDHGRRPPRQVCVVAEDDRPEHPFVLGSRS